MSQAKKEITEFSLEEKKEHLRAEKKRWQNRLDVMDKRLRFIVDYETTKSPIKYWDLFVLVLLVFTAIFAPFEMAFITIEAGSFLYVLNRLVDTCFFFDIALNFFVVYYCNDEGKYIRKYSLIAMHYIRGWFFIDLLATIPFDLIIVGQEKYIKVIRCLKLLRLIRVRRIVRRFQPEFGLRYSFLDLFYCVIGTLLLSHVGACFWGLAPGFADGEGWMGPEAYDVWDKGVYTIYLSSLHWSVMTMTTIGYGDIGPTNDLERIFSICFMLAGACMYAYVVGAICSIVDGIDVSQREFRNKMDNLNQYMSEIDFPILQRVQMRQYFLQNRDRFRHIHNSKVLPLMSPGLREKFSYKCSNKWLKGIKSFRCTLGSNCDKRKLTEVKKLQEEQAHICMEVRQESGCYEQTLLYYAIMDYLRLESFPRREVVINQNEKAEKIYVIKKGLVASKGVLLSKGKVVGEDFLLNFILDDPRRSYSVVTLTFVDVFSIDIKHLREVLKKGDFPHITRTIRRSAIKMALKREFIQEANRIKAKFQSANLTLHIDKTNPIETISHLRNKKLCKKNISQKHRKKKNIDLLNENVEQLTSILCAMKAVQEQKNNSNGFIVEC